MIKFINSCTLFIDNVFESLSLNVGNIFYINIVIYVSWIANVFCIFCIFYYVNYVNYWIIIYYWKYFLDDIYTYININININTTVNENQNIL